LVINICSIHDTRSENHHTNVTSRHLQIPRPTWCDPCYVAATTYGECEWPIYSIRSWLRGC